MFGSFIEVPRVKMNNGVEIPMIGLGTDRVCKTAKFIFFMILNLTKT
jgi:hypothetical protein